MDDVSRSPMPESFSLQVLHGSLSPEEHPLAVTDENIQAIVVSRETVAGADWINQERAKKSFRALEIVVVDLVSTQTHQSTVHHKPVCLSIHRLRKGTRNNTNDVNVLDKVGAEPHAGSESNKLSSTELREVEAREQQQQRNKARKT